MSTREEYYAKYGNDVEKQSKRAKQMLFLIWVLVVIGLATISSVITVLVFINESLKPVV